MAIEYIYDETYNVVGWFDSTLKVPGWFDKGFTETTGGGGGPATVTGVGTADLGGLSSTTTATVTHNATGSAALGGLSSTTTATVTRQATGVATLGALTSSATATVSHPATGTGALGALTSTTTATVTHQATGTADLGALTSTIVVPGGEPPATEDPGHSHSWGRPKPRRFITPTPARLPRDPRNITATASAQLGGLKSTAIAVAFFDSTDDDELLLLV